MRGKACPLTSQNGHCEYTAEFLSVYHQNKYPGGM